MTFTSDTVALVTGAASGIGAATVAALRVAGVGRFVLIDVTEPSAEPDDLVRRHDVADPAAWAETEALVLARYGGIALAVVNAGIVDAGPITDLPFERWRRVLGVNLDGAFLTLQTSMRLIADGGAIVCTGSAAALRGTAGNASYSASKAALIQLARVAASEGAPRGVRVNCVAPGPVATGIWRTMPDFAAMAAAAGGEEAMLSSVASAVPLGRMAEPQEVAAQIVHMLAPASRSITGACLVMDGGWSN